MDPGFIITTVGGSANKVWLSVTKFENTDGSILCGTGTTLHLTLYR
ncbi:MAG: hypothetical protein ACJAVI_002892 [Candidatus Azotimanducaceae bacterium]|jgi:hypothetical protein